MTLLDYLAWLIPLGLGFTFGWAFGLDAGRRSVVIALPAETDPLPGSGTETAPDCT